MRCVRFSKITEKWGQLFPHIFFPIKYFTKPVRPEDYLWEFPCWQRLKQPYKAYTSSLPPDSGFRILKDRLLEEVCRTFPSLLVQQTCASLQNVATCQLVIKLARALYLPTDPRQPVFQGLFLAGLWRKCTKVWAWFINRIKQVSSLTP